VAIAAADIAFLDLGANDRDRAHVDQAPDVRCLRGGIPMIEFEDDAIRLTAVDARVRHQVFGDELTIAWSIDRSSGLRPRDVLSDVLPVMLFPVVAAAGPAVRAMRSPRCVLDRELVDWLREMAARADADITHRDTRDRGCGPYSAPIRVSRTSVLA